MGIWFFSDMKQRVMNPSAPSRRLTPSPLKARCVKFWTVCWKKSPDHSSRDRTFSNRPTFLPAARAVWKLPIFVWRIWLVTGSQSGKNPVPPAPHSAWWILRMADRSVVIPRKLRPIFWRIWDYALGKTRFVFEVLMCFFFRYGWVCWIEGLFFWKKFKADNLFTAPTNNNVFLVMLAEHPVLQRYISVGCRSTGERERVRAERPRVLSFG